MEAERKEGKSDIKTMKRRTENEIHTILSFGVGFNIMMEKDRFTPSVFSEIRYGEKEGIGVYYPVYRDGSCAKAEYIKFSYGKNGKEDVVFLERASRNEMQEYDKERLGHLLRR